MTWRGRGCDGGRGCGRGTGQINVDDNAILTETVISKVICILSLRTYGWKKKSIVDPYEILGFNKCLSRELTT